MSHRLLLANLLLALSAGSAMAQDVRLYGAGEAVDPQDVVRILDQSKPAAPVLKMRSIRLLDEPPVVAQAATEPAPAAAPAATASPTAAPAAAAPRPAPSALALPVQFAFDSSDILPAARPQLDALAEGIRLLPGAQVVVIEGHTDARGSEHYNEQLSLQRALSVRRYLVAIQGIDPARLRTLGMGEYATLPGRDPHAPENRRVQFRGG